MARLSGVETATTFATGVAIGLPLAEILGLKAEGARLRKDMAETEAKIKKISTKLENPQFLAKAPDGVIQENRHRLGDEKAKFDGLAAALSRKC